jgi:xanthine dehydrogenase YagS FAD-binding subunit
MADVARSALVLAQAPSLAQALLASASPQVRNVATLGGNLLQRTRCPYYRGQASACNKAHPGSGCAMLTGDQRHAAVFGVSPHCRATQASDLAVALLTLDAQLVVQGPNAQRRIGVDALYPTLTADAQLEHTLGHDELITAIELPLSDAARTSTYLKVRDRASFQFALVSLAVALQTTDGVVSSARLAAGGVGTRPWRLHASEDVLIGQTAGPETWRAAALAATHGAEALPGNAFKLELLQRCVAHTLARYTGEPS